MTSKRAPRLILLVVVTAGHLAVAIILTVYASKPAGGPAVSDATAFIIEFLPADDPEASAKVVKPKSRTSPPRMQKRQDAPQPIPEIPPTPEAAQPLQRPSIDWAAQARMAAGDLLEDAERRSHLRDLSGMSEVQKQWLKTHGFEPMPPAFHFSHSNPGAVEVVDGVPILHINNNCVLVAMVIPFCVIGHIEARGDLFKHMHDPTPATQ